VEAGSVQQRLKWFFDTTFEFTQYHFQPAARANLILAAGRDTHGHQREFDVSERFAYSVLPDLTLSLSQGYRSLALKEIDDPDMLGRREHSNGASDLELGVQYRILHQRESGGPPCDLLFFTSVKAPTGVTDNRRPDHNLFETEDQPGSGSWNETAGLSAGKRWGNWGASAAYGYTHKGEGSQRFKEGDVNRLTLAASRRVSPDDWSCKVFLSQGVQGFIEKKAVDHGETGPDHGGRFIYAAPGVTLQPNRRLLIGISASVPLYQQENGFHQPDNFGLQLNVGLRF
jgi:hypothetical protein